MIDEGRRSTVKEIIAKYKREPELAKTIYVEGSTDKSLIKWFLKQANIKDVLVVEINKVELDISKIFELKLDDNERGRVITLTTLVDKGIIGVIDSDFDFLKESTYPQNENLCKTDYACMEMYCFNEETLEKILLGYGDSKQPKDFSEFKLMLANILVELFLIRYAKDNVEKSLSKLDFGKYINIKSKTLNFNREEYLSKYVSNKTELIDKFNKFIDDTRTILPEDCRKTINGHDFVPLMQIYLGIKQGKEVFERSIYSSLEFDKLKEEEMFQNIISLVNV